jgi:enolase
MKIQHIDAYQILDSRGNPTIEAEVRLDDGAVGRGAVPSGASVGQFEAIELRDRDPRHFRGRSMLRAVEHVRTTIGDAIRGLPADNQALVDKTLIDLDGTPDKSRLGANAILAVSMAVAAAAARARRLELFEHLGDGGPYVLPIPQIQIIGGGAHAKGRLDIQDFLVIPLRAESFLSALEVAFNVYHAVGELLSERRQYFGVADEGGYWPSFSANEEALELLTLGIERAGYISGVDVGIALDVAASNLFRNDERQYEFASEGRRFTSEAFAELLTLWRSRYAIISIEDPIADDDRLGWKMISERLGDRVQLVGDDLFTTNLKRIRAGVVARLANAVLIKLNQIGTVTETLAAIRATQAAGWAPIVSARSGETEDAFISHLAVATSAGQLKVGSIVRGERTAKWNEILRIEHRLKQVGGARGPLHWPAKSNNS